MCGIAGIIALRHGSQAPRLPLESMAAALQSRGPDAGGIWFSPDRRAGFGHRRLAIVDLSPAGAQPMTDDSGRYTITFNGEIYNFREIRKNLEQQGTRFRSHSDTEVLLNLYRAKGARMVDDLAGDYAFAIWDQVRQEIFICRDRLGIKPLYYAITGDHLVFASTVTALLDSDLVRKDIDPQSLHAYLSYLATPPDRTMIVGIRKLPAASTLTLRPGQPEKIEKYWQPLPQVPVATDDRDLDAEFAQLFDESVRKRLMADVPVGVLFSGGVDSTLNAGAFSRLTSPDPVDTFTVGMPGTRQDESLNARKMSAHLGTRHHEVLIGERDVLDHLDAITRAQDEPLSDPVCLPLYFVSKLAREHGVTVLQAGEGADEIFCGYSSYIRQMSAYRRFWRTGAVLPASWPRAGARLLRPYARSHAQVAAAADTLQRLGTAQPFFLSSAIGFYDSEKTDILSPDYGAACRDYSASDVVAPLYDILRAEAPKASFLQQMTFIDLQVRLSELLLMRVDKMSMAHGIEVRVPFLDHKLVEFSMRVPDAWKLRHGIPKEPVKKLAARYAPRAEIYKDKKGFGAPVLQWFTQETRTKDSLAQRLRDLLSDPASGADQYFDTAALQQRLDNKSMQSREAFQLWTVYNFLLWKKLLGL